ncbi:hypothetical protein [Methanoculleus sp.]|uniref:hypothetical protein n=1 Tax=Methanoculleus sp. TaxID=90427 RepID=UPI0025DA95C0|nr:hypothetical protein [Methanoculleus sp.]
MALDISEVPIPSDPELPEIAIAGLVIIFFGLTLYFVMPWLSAQISLLGIYHRQNYESLKRKVRFVATIYFLLSIPLMVSYIVILLTLSVTFDSITSLLVISTTMATLLVIRIHGNPSETSIIRFRSYFPQTEWRNIIEQHRERILSFIFSLITAQIIVALLGAGYTVSQNYRYQVEIETTTILVFGFLYVMGLFLTTLIGEYYLSINPPVHQVGR